MDTNARAGAVIGTIIGTGTEGTIDRGEGHATGSTESTGADTPDRPVETDGGATAGIIRTAMGGTTAGGTAATGTATTVMTATGDE